MNTRNAILVLGGGLDESGELNEWSTRRVQKAVELYNIQKPDYVMTLSRGTTYKPPPLDAKGFPLDESVIQAALLVEKDVPKEVIRMERLSLDTVGNAYYARLLFVEPLKIQKLWIITSEFHMPRTEAVFHWLMYLDPVIPGLEIEYVSVSDKGIDEDLLQGRIKKEEENLKKFIETQKSLRSMDAVHTWLYTQHNSYMYGGTPWKIDPKLVKTY